MVGSILQMAGAILLGYYIAFRGSTEIRKLAIVQVPVAGEKLAREIGLFIETRAYRIGFIYIILGYIIQMLDIDSEYLINLDRFSKLMAIIVFNIILVFIGKYLAEYWGRKAYNNSEEFNPETDLTDNEKDETNFLSKISGFLMGRIFSFACFIYVILAILFVINDLRGVENNISENFITGAGFLFTVLGSMIAFRQSQKNKTNY